MKFTIPLEPRTKKNHQMIARGRIIQGEAYRQYEKDALWFLPKMEPPIMLPAGSLTGRPTPIAAAIGSMRQRFVVCCRTALPSKWWKRPAAAVQVR